MRKGTSAVADRRPPYNVVDVLLFASSDSSEPVQPSSPQQDDLVVRVQERERGWVEGVRRNDQAALASIMESYVASLIRFATHIIGSRDLAEDIVQYVFIRIWDRRATLDPERPLKPYLFRAVHNRALDERKASRVRALYRQQFVGDCVAGAVQPTVPSPEGEILTLAAIQSALEQLPERRRVALRLRLEEFSHAEIGEIMGVSSVAAQSLVSRALADVRNILRRI
jgi:RNA polymerase sigma-70 factor (ECF subfamily)